MRFMPQSLFGRLLVLLLGGLMGAQLLSALLHLQDRGEVLYRAAMVDVAQHIAAVSKRLNALPAEERQRLVEILDFAPTRIQFGANGQIPHTTDGQHAATFKSLLQRYLPATLPLQVEAVDAGWVNARAGKTPQTSLPQDSLEYLVAASQFRIQVSLDDGTVVSFWHQLPDEILQWPYRLILGLSLLALGVVIVAVVAAHWLTQPTRRLMAAATSLGRGINGPPLDERGPLEVCRVAQAFNGYINDRSRLLASISHDLKTPITRLRLRTEMLNDAALKQKFQNDLSEMETMVIATLDFVRGAEQNEPVKLLDINALLESLQEDYAESGGDIEIDGAARIPFSGRLSALKRCLSNLLDNGLRYGQRVRVEVEDSADWLVIVIRDQGPGIPEAELEQVFEPFYRLEQSRARYSGGTGLGLGIARNIARAHGGNLILRNSPRGGLEAILRLPRR